MDAKRACIYIDKAAILHNLSLAYDITKTRILAVVKANAYGLGAVPIAEFLSKVDFVSAFGVATPKEGVILRNAGIKKPIYILSAPFNEDYKDIVTNDLIPAITCIEDARTLLDMAKDLGRRVDLDIKIDTGMGRIGFSPDEKSAEEINSLSGHKGLGGLDIFTHFPRADEEDFTVTQKSIEIFRGFIKRLEDGGVKFRYHHCQNSAASLRGRLSGMELIRSGILTYGVNPFEDGEFAQDIKSVVSFKSHIIHLKEVNANTPISYGGTFVSERKSRIATVPVGYADGIPRDYSNCGEVLIRGKKAPIVGRVCMDQMMVDVTDIPGVSRYDEVTILGRDGNESIEIKDMSELSGRFVYEILTCLGNRVTKVYV